jgi:hypothetical protein
MYDLVTIEIHGCVFYIIICIERREHVQEYSELYNTYGSRICKIGTDM